MNGRQLEEYQRSENVRDANYDQQLSSETLNLFNVTENQQYQLQIQDALENISLANNTVDHVLQNRTETIRKLSYNITYFLKNISLAISAFVSKYVVSSEFQQQSLFGKYSYSFVSSKFKIIQNNIIILFFKFPDEDIRVALIILKIAFWFLNPIA